MQEISDGSDGDRSYGTRVWDARRDSETAAAVRRLTDFYCGSSKRDATERRPWERLVDETSQRLCAADETAGFHRPPARTDRLFNLQDTAARD